MSTLLVAQGLRKTYQVRRAGLLRPERRMAAVDGVSLAVARGETLGIVGESGCGKSTLARLLLGLITPDAGEVLVDDAPVLGPSEADWRALRTRMQLVYQDAAGALDPRMCVRAQVEEPLRIHSRHLEAADRALQAVGLGGAMADRFPHELSGGQLQRVVIARALALEPALMVLDEPVSALDVSIQAQIVNLLVTLQRDHGLTYVFVSHDIGIVRHISDRMAVMYLGQVVEAGPTAQVGEGPLHPYTQALLAAVPEPDPTRRRVAAPAIGDPPDPARPPTGCRFHPRCPRAIDRCRSEAPALRAFGPVQAACHLIDTRPADAVAEAVRTPEEV